MVYSVISTGIENSTMLLKNLSLNFRGEMWIQLNFAEQEGMRESIGTQITTFLEVAQRFQRAVNVFRKPSMVELYGTHQTSHNPHKWSGQRLSFILRDC